MKKYTLNEDFEDEVVAVPEVVVPEEVVAPEIAPDPEIVNNGLRTLLNNAVKREFEYLDYLNSDIATIKQEAPDKTDIISILEEIATEKNIHVGMLTKALSLLDDNSQELMNMGIEKAEQIISEPSIVDLQ